MLGPGRAVQDIDFWHGKGSNEVYAEALSIRRHATPAMLSLHVNLIFGYRSFLCGTGFVMKLMSVAI